LYVKRCIATGLYQESYGRFPELSHPSQVSSEDRYRCFINEAVRTQSYSGQSSLRATFKIIFNTITIVPLGGLLLGEIKWNRSS